jgi:glycosyltransferase involved in cell wall biosynthesis
MVSNGPLKILFIQVSRNATTEYEVHRILADRADPKEITSYFFWQRSKDWNESSPARQPRDYFFDFGRDLSIEPKPNRVRRAFMMFRRFPANFVRLCSLVRNIGPNIIYVSQQRHDLYLAVVMELLFKIRYIVHVHYPVGPWLGPATLAILPRSRHTIACSDFVRGTLIRNGSDEINIQVIHNPVRLDKFLLPRKSHPFRDECNIPRNAPVIVSAGRIDPEKGHAALVDAFWYLRDRFPQVYTIICGQTFGNEEYATKLVNRVKTLGLERRVFFLGQRRDLPEIFADCQIFCLPTLEEAFGLVFIEAMAAGLPVVACQSGAVPEIVVNGITGLLSEPGDFKKLAANLELLLVNPDLAAQLGKAGRMRAQTEFTPALITKLWTAHLLLLSQRMAALG